MRSTAVRSVAEPVSSPAVFRRCQLILAAFNTWAYKREQPSDPALLTAVVTEAAHADRPVPFVLYWGKGPRETLAQPDEDCLDYLAGMMSRIQAVHPAGARVDLLLTDTHARLNHHSDRSIDAYFAAVAAAAAVRGFSSRRLSAVVAATPPLGIVDTESAADPVILDHLTQSASKWYRGEGTARCGAIQYYAMNMRERRAVEAAFPHAIFISFNNSKSRALFPQRLPIFYMYSMRKGVAVKPWFIETA